MPGSPGGTPDALDTRPQDLLAGLRPRGIRGGPVRPPNNKVGEFSGPVGKIRGQNYPPPLSAGPSANCALLFNDPAFGNGEVKWALFPRRAYATLRAAASDLERASVPEKKSARNFLPNFRLSIPNPVIFNYRYRERRGPKLKIMFPPTRRAITRRRDVLSPYFNEKISRVNQTRPTANQTEINRESSTGTPH